MSLVVVDENDRVVGSADYDKVHSNGLLHRFVLVYVFDKNGKLFLQKRANSKKHGKMWAESVCAHVREGEDYLKTAKRRLREELGLDEKISKVCKIRVDTEESGWKNKSFVEIYKCTTSKEPKINPEEIQSGVFMYLQDVKEMFYRQPNSFVPGFKATFEAFLKSKDPL